jgi:2-polyprenyl-6-methoxyphenol hydroxylase-like FAD-dependent oxidoreductase
MEVAIIGGGVCGLSLALHLAQRGIASRVYERAAEIKELGVGITLLPHAMREFSALGLAEKLTAAGIENRESRFYNRFGQLIYKEPRGKFAGYQYPEVGIHRGKLHMILYEAARERLGDDAIHTDHEALSVAQDERGATVHFRGREPLRADVVIDCEGINSAIRKQFYPQDQVAFAGINTWRGVTRHKPIFDGRTYMRVGSILTGKLVIYPIVDDIDGRGNQLVNWMAEIKRDTYQPNDWNKPGNLADFFPLYQSWTFDWLDAAQMIRDADQILEYPMVDKDPIDTWTFGRVTLAGDAAHPMYPRGSNGAAQAAIDARTLADFLRSHTDPRDALKAYEQARVSLAARVVRTNREQPPDFINIKVEELVGDKPFDDLDKYITQDELRALSENYKRIAGFALADDGLGRR